MARRESSRVASQKSNSKPIHSSTFAKSTCSTSHDSGNAAVDFSNIERKIFEGSGHSLAAVAPKIRISHPASLIVERVNYNKGLDGTKGNGARKFNKNSIPENSTAETSISNVECSSKMKRASRSASENVQLEAGRKYAKLACNDVKIIKKRASDSQNIINQVSSGGTKSSSKKVDAKSSSALHSSNSCNYKPLEATQSNVSKSILRLPESKNTKNKSKVNKIQTTSEKQDGKCRVLSSLRKTNLKSKLSDSCKWRKSSHSPTKVYEIESKKANSNNPDERLYSGKFTDLSRKSHSHAKALKSTECSSTKSSTSSHKLSEKARSSKNSLQASSVPLRAKRSSSGFKKHSQSSESELSDWEDVQGSDTANTTWNNLDSLLQKDEAAALDLLTKGNVGGANKGQDQQLSTSNVQIELEAPTLWGMKKRMKNKKSDEYWMMVHLRREVNQTIREDYLNCHKVHLLLLLGHGQHINRLLNSEELLASALSIVSNKEVYPPKRIDLGYLEKFARWFTKKIPHVEEPLENGYWVVPLTKVLAKRFEKKETRTAREAVFMFVLIGRALGMSVRLVWSLKPLHWKPSSEELFRPPVEADGQVTEPKKQEAKKDTQIKKTKGENTSNRIVSSSSSSGVELKKSNICKSKGKAVIGKNPSASISKRKQEVGLTESMSNDDSDDDSDFEIAASQKKKKRAKKGRSSSSGKGNHSANSTKSSNSSSSSCKRSLSVDSKKESENKKKKVETFPEWAEVYVEEEEQWICVDVIRGKIHCAAELASRAPAPVAHVTAFNPDQSVKDVTKRYVSSWLAYEAKLRCDSSWWGRVLAPYAPAFSPREKVEDRHMDESLKQQPLPKTLAEYKNHPMYALQRHLLKFEALYPPNPDPVGYFKGEAVFPRECVYNLHSRDIWLKEAKTVRVDEEPYKVVKARPKWDRVLCQMITGRPLEVFGVWQVEDYQPPVAKDGRVPRNEYGNVELYKPTMLPVGTVRLPAEYEDINRVARKLKIDCAPAMVGFDFHKGGCHPVFDGYVVCTEFKEILMDAWREEMELKAKREEFKRVRRIYDNWKRLIHGMIVKHHVREQYGTGQDSSDEGEQDCVGDTGRKKAKGITNTKKDNGSKGATKTNSTKKKIKQKDIEAAKPENLKNEKVQLGIDFKSDTVTSAKNSFKQALSSKGMVVNDKIDGVDSGLHSIVPKEEDLILDSDEEMKETEDEKKRNMQKILAWGNNSKRDALAGLSDDSDLEGERTKKVCAVKSEPSDDARPDPTSRCGTVKGTTEKSANPKLQFNKSKLDDQEVSSDLESTNGKSSKTPTAAKRKKLTKKKQPAPLKINTSNLTADAGATRRRSSRRSAARGNSTAVYKESEESDISLNESDLDDKTFKPPEHLEAMIESASPLALGCDDLDLSEDSN